MQIVDVGANIGVYTVLAGSLVGKDGRVYSFEPTPSTYEILKNNVQLNRLLETGRIILHQLAVADKEGTLDFAVYENNSGHNTLYPTKNEKEIIQVKTVALDSLLSSDMDLVKIDAEGAEPLILYGMKEIIKRKF